MMNLNSKYLNLCMVVLAMYLMLMDLGFYLELQNLPIRGESKESNVSSPTFVYSPFKPITIKQLMLPATVQVIFIDFFFDPCSCFKILFSSIWMSHLPT